MVCKNCGKENKYDTKFCIQCGSKLEKIIVDKNSEIDENSVDNSEDTIEYVNNVNYSNSANNQDGDNLSTANKKNTGLIVILVIAFIIAIVGVSAVILWKTNSNKISGNDVNSNNSISNKNNTSDNNDKVNTKDNSDKNNNKSDNSKNFETKYDNYNITVDLSMEASGMSVDASFTGTVDQKNQVEYLKMSMNMLGMNMSSETYTDLKNGITYTSEPLTGSWIKETGASQMVDLDEFLNELKNMKNVEKVDNNHFKIKITNEDIKGMLDASDVNLNDFGGEISADVFTNNGYIEEIKYDFGNISEELGTFKMNIKLSNYNKAGSITIPDEVIEKATEF